MTRLVRDLMTPHPVTLQADSSVQNAAEAMREQDIGDVLVVEDGRLRGIVTDRDIVVRGVAHFDDLTACSLGDVCGDQLLTATPDEEADAAITRMREAAVHRIPVVDDGQPVGVLSIGDATGAVRSGDPV
jgi:CBS domain-containing protein